MSKPGQTVMGMDAETATEVFSSIEQLDIEGVLAGSLDSPRIQIDYDKLTANIREAACCRRQKRTLQTRQRRDGQGQG